MTNATGTSIPRHQVVCPSCGRSLPRIAHHCPNCPDALLQSVYRRDTFEPIDRPDIFRFADWLPCDTTIPTSVGPAVVHNDRLNETVGLPQLAIGFNGYAPSLGATNPTASFKDFEALPTLLMLREHGVQSIVLASAGNTARAFADAGALLDFTVYIVVPEAMLYRVWIPRRPSPSIRLVVIDGSKDYSTAIRCAGLLSTQFDIQPEGGARNVARRDGMAAAMLEYARVHDGLPQHYVQAVGSGTGAVAAWEGAKRLLATGQFPDAELPKLHIAQNAPFAPLHDAWTNGIPIRPDHDTAGQLRRIAPIVADVLANRNPPYALAGGVRDALTDCNGFTYAVTNDEIATAQRLFLSCVGVSIGPAAGVALAALRQALSAGRIAADESVLLHVTGNGDELLRRDFTVHGIEPWLHFPPSDVSPESIERFRDRFADA